MESEIYTTPKPAQYPLCTEIFCREFFLDTPANLVNYMLQIDRFALAIIILLLGLKMEKDFMRSITITIFIPMTVREIMALYLDWMYYYIQFSKNSTIAKENYKYISWSPQLQNSLNLYIHYNTLLMMVLMLHCCRLAYRYGDQINPFPVNTFCLVLQLIPFFIGALNYQETQSLASTLIDIVSNIASIVGFCLLTVQIIAAIPLLMTPLPYAHSASYDIQLQDARSRFAWTLIYMILPYITLIPDLIASITWAILMCQPKNPEPTENPMKERTTFETINIFCEAVAFEINIYKLTWMVAITIAFLPPYRRAVPLLFCCCPCCPKVQVDPVPRKPTETSIMYKYADV